MQHKNIREFERPVEEIEKKIEELRFSREMTPDVAREIRRLEEKRDRLIKDIYSGLTPWQITLVARHPARPYTLDYIGLVFDEFEELHGDRLYRDDPAIVGGLARMEGRKVVVIGHQKGRNTKERFYRNYGMPHPEGYRKAKRLMELAQRFSRPIVTFIDTPGAAPDIEAEERGQAVAIAENLLFMAGLGVPVVSAVIGEGGSGGALAIGVANRVLMLEYSIYSVISPEGCAAILWKDGSKAELAAAQLRMSAKELEKLGIIDRVVEEPPGGAHRNYELAAKNLKKALLESLEELSALTQDELREARYRKFRRMGVSTEGD